MTLQALIADPEAPSAPPAPAAAPEAAPCENCGAPLAPGQGWCLECGSAAAGVLGRGPSWRQAATVIGLTVLIVAGAVAASYAALSHQAKRATTAPKIVAYTPPPAAPATPVTPPAATATPKLPKLPAATPKPVVPKLPVAAAPRAAATVPPARATPPPAAPKAKPRAAAPSGGQTNSTGQTGNTILLDPNAASTYNPGNLPDSSFGDPSLAIDGDQTTAWTYTLDPSTAGRTAVGLAIDLKTPHRVRSIKTIVTSPAMAVEYYGANGASPPPAITDPGWTKLAARPVLKHRTTVALATGGRTYRWLLVWITHAPPKVTTGSVGIAELSVLR